MSYSEAQGKATRKYRDKAYDQMNLQIKKGTKETYKQQAAAHGMSLNAYIVHLLDKDKDDIESAESKE